MTKSGQWPVLSELKKKICLFGINYPIIVACTRNGRSGQKVTKM